MAFLSIAGTDYDVLTSGAALTFDVQGETFRAYSGRYRSVRRGQKRNWGFTLGPLTQAQYAVLDAAIIAGTVTLGGNAFNGETPSCFVEITRMEFVSGNFGGNDFYATVDIVAHEQ